MVAGFGAAAAERGRRAASRRWGRDRRDRSAVSPRRALRRSARRTRAGRRAARASSRSGSWSSTSSQALTVSGYGQPSSVGNSGSVVRAIATSGCGMGPMVAAARGSVNGRAARGAPAVVGATPVGERGADARERGPAVDRRRRRRPRPGARRCSSQGLGRTGCRRRRWPPGARAHERCNSSSARPSATCRSRRSSASCSARSPTRSGRDPARGR